MCPMRDRDPEEGAEAQRGIELCMSPGARERECVCVCVCVVCMS